MKSEGSSSENGYQKKKKDGISLLFFHSHFLIHWMSKEPELSA